MKQERENEEGRIEAVKIDLHKPSREGSERPTADRVQEGKFWSEGLSTASAVYRGDRLWSILDCGDSVSETRLSASSPFILKSLGHSEWNHKANPTG